MRRGAALLLQAVLLAAPVFAAEQAHHAAEHESHGIPWATLLFSTINFIIFVAILRRFLWPQVQRFLRERHDQVVAELEAAARAKAEAEQAQRQWQQRLADLESEITALRARAQQDAAKERERILAAAQKAAEALRRDAERAAAAEIRRTQQALREEMVRDAVRLASEATRKGWTAEDQQRALSNFLKQVQA